jgi:hypothetical protein
MYSGAGIIASASEAGMGKSPVLLGALIPRRAHGPREQESPLAPQALPPTMDVYRECATEGCAELVCSGGDRQNVQSPYCGDACWHRHAKDGRVHEPADTKAWTDDTTSAIWGRGRLNEVHVTPRSTGALRVNIEIGDPLRGVFERQWREQAESLRVAQAVQVLIQHQQAT